MTDRATLASAISDWLSRGDLGTSVDTIITLTEARIARDVRHWAQVKSATITVDSGSFNLVLPTDYRVQRIISLSLSTIDSRPELEEQAPSALRGSNLQTLRGTPIKFAIEGQNLVFAPQSNGGTDSSTLVMVYYERFAPLVLPGDTNQLLCDHFDLYLAAALAQGAKLLQDLQLAAGYDADYERARESVRKEMLRHQRTQNFQATRLRVAP